MYSALKMLNSSRVGDRFSALTAVTIAVCTQAKAAQEVPEAVEIPAAPEPIVSQEEQLWQ